MVKEGDALMNLIQKVFLAMAEIVAKPGELVCPGGPRCHGGPWTKR